jgi:hypothetical protein
MMDLTVARMTSGCQEVSQCWIVIGIPTLLG